MLVFLNEYLEVLLNTKQQYTVLKYLWVNPYYLYQPDTEPSLLTDRKTKENTILYSPPLSVCRWSNVQVNPRSTRYSPPLPVCRWSNVQVNPRSTRYSPTLSVCRWSNVQVNPRSTRTSRRLESSSPSGLMISSQYSFSWVSMSFARSASAWWWGMAYKQVLYWSFSH